MNIEHEALLVTPRQRRTGVAVKGRYARNMDEAGTAVRGIEQEAGVLDDRQSLIPAADRIDDPTTIEDGGGWRPKCRGTSNLGIGIDVLHSPRNNFGQAPRSIHARFKALPVAVGHVRSRVLERRDAFSNRVR